MKRTLLIGGLTAALTGAGPAAATPPTPAQVAALGELEREAAVYEGAARDYRGTITGIVQHHYQDRRRQVLAGLDAEIAVEKQGLRDAREAAIRRLEAFVAAHGGADAQPEHTPDAMFRLAALYEERARTDTDASEDLSRGLRPAIALYKRILREFPGYRERAGVHYYLGHAYDDAGRPREAQQVWRALVCQNHFPYPTTADPGDPERDTVRALPQDHDREHWQGWRAQRPAPGGRDLTFENPYPEDCRPIPQQTVAGLEPRYLAEAWWLIGDHHFNEVDAAGGPFNLNRAEAAYRRSLRFKKPPVHGVAMYKLAWTYFKQQRYEAAVRQFVELLRITDEQQRLTGDAGADFRGEAYTYIAGSLTYADFAGPDADAPWAPRQDTLDTETDPRAAEQKMRVALERVQDGRLIPQDAPWTIDIYRALAQELRDLGQLHSMIELDELTLKRWPLHREAPLVQDEIATAYDRLASVEREGTAARAETSARALEARTRLSAYVGTTPWVQRHLGDHEAILAADRLARGGLRRAAADHTNAGSALVQQADALGEGATRDRARERALAEYRLAAQAWGSAPSREEGPESYERSFWQADAEHRIVALQVALGRSPAPGEIDAARASATAVRDSNEDGRYQEPAAQFVVDLAEQVLADRHAVFLRSHGAEGLAPRDQVQTTGTGAAEHVLAEPLPREVAEAVSARDEYVARVPAARDPAHNAALFRYQAADLLLVYGQLDEARRRLTPIYEAECGKSTYGFKAWRKLVRIAALEHDGDRSAGLARAALARSCALGADDGPTETGIARGTLTAVDYESAGKLFEATQQMPEGPARARQWREVARLYRGALEQNPSSDAAPEAALNGAYASKQVGDHGQAIALYELLVREYGSEASLARIERGDPAATPPTPPDPGRYAARLGFLERAYRGLEEAYVLLFDYRRAAATYDAVAESPRFGAPLRREAARSAALLHGSLGDRGRLAATRATLLRLDAPADQRAEIDYQVADAALRGWDERGLDEGPNRAARLEATAAMDAYHAANKGNAAAAIYTVRAAYHAAMLRRAGKDPRAAESCRDAVSAFDRLRAASRVLEGRNQALGSPEADLAAECAYQLADEKIRADRSGAAHPRYEGTIDRVKTAYESDLRDAEAHAGELQAIITAFASRRWSAEVRARQASLYDGCRTRLYWAQAPAVKLFTPREERVLSAAESSDNPQLQAQADELRQKRRENWREARARLLEDADRHMVRGYVEATLWARAWQARGPALDAAIQRLAFFTPVLGDARLRAYSAGVTDPETRQPFEYRDGLFLTTRPGLALAPSGEGLPAPRPALP